VYAIAAGNGNPFTGQAMNACLTSPAGAGLDYPGVNGVITVAATDPQDAEASFSNYGVCVNLWAPGVDVTSTWLMSEGGTITASGTSFASPYVAGAAVLLLSRAPALTPPVVEFLLRVVADVPGTLSKDGAAIRRLQVRYF
jgi:subtilisin family serine protease